MSREDREEQVIDAAVEVFARRGFHNASMDEISGVASVSKPTVYAYGGSKEDLFAACLRREGERMSSAIAGAVDPVSAPEQQLRQGLEAIFRYFHGQRDTWFSLYRQAVAHGEPFAGQVERTRDQLTELVVDLLRRARRRHGQETDESSLEVHAHALVGATEAVAGWMLNDAHATPERAATVLLDLMWGGLGAHRDQRGA